MSLDDRFLIEDLVARYELEPALRDVFVEGLFDKEVLTEGCITGVNDGRVYYEIDSVFVPDELLERVGLTPGNKQRVIALALSLQEVSQAASFRCLVDRDLDEWIGGMVAAGNLRWTKYVDLEAYFLSSEQVRRYVVTVAKAKIPDWDAFYSSFLGVLRELYAMRLAAKEIGLNITWVKLDKSLLPVGSEIRFAGDSYVDKVMNQNRLMPRRDDFVAAVGRWAAALVGDPRSFARGHDFIFLIAWAVGKYKGLPGYSSEESVERLLVITSRNIDDLVEIVI